MRLIKAFTAPSLAILLACFSVSSFAATLKIATLSPDGSSWMNIMRDAGKQITEQTEGRVKVRYYPGGVMGNDNAVFRKIRARQLQGAAVTGGSLSSFYDDSNIYSLPFIFNDFAEVDYVRQAMDQSIIDGLDNNGWVILGIAEGGMAYIMSQQPIRTPEELAQQKTWIPADSEATLTALASYDINITSLALPDVLTGLQSGLINTITSSPVAAIALQWHTQIKYITEMPISYFFGAMAIDKKAFNKISKADRAIVRKIYQQAFDELNQVNRRDNEKALAALQQQGVELVKLSDQQIQLWLPIAEKNPQDHARKRRNYRQ